MASVDYIVGRKKYSRPQALLWADNPGSLVVLEGGTANEQRFYVPGGYENRTDPSTISDTELLNSFIILSDDGRSPIDFSTERIEKRERMINGRMRSYHIADKLNISFSWDMLPSRSYRTSPNFNPDDGTSNLNGTRGAGFDQEFTTDGGAGGVEILKWYEDHSGPFWVYLAYDKNTSFQNRSNQYGQLDKYNQVVEMYFSDFSYSVVKRGNGGHDFWNVSVTLEEV